MNEENTDMLGSIVNAAAIAAGGLIGLLLKKGLPERLNTAIMQGLALIVFYIGASGAFVGEETLVSTFSIVIGGTIGTLLDLDGRLERFAHGLERRLVKTDDPNSTFGQGFVNATMLFCVGAMAVVGSLNAGLANDYRILFSKSLIDGISAIVFASALGGGVLLSAIPVLVYQGAITLLASAITPLLITEVVNEMTCVGSLLIVAISFNMLNITKIKVMNFVPGIFLPIIWGLFL